MMTIIDSNMKMLQHETRNVHVFIELDNYSAGVNDEHNNKRGLIFILPWNGEVNNELLSRDVITLWNFNA